MKVDYRMQYYGVITNPRWRTTANMKIVMIRLFGTLNHIGTILNKKAVL